MLSINIWQCRWNVWQPVVPVVPRNRTRIVAPTFSNSASWRSTLLFVRGFYYSTAMRSGNDQFPHGGISIVASSVTRFDTPKINSSVDPWRAGRREVGEKKEVTGLTVFARPVDLSSQSWISASSVIRTTNARESPERCDARIARGANFPRVIAPLHRSNSATLKETVSAALAELVSSGCDRVQKSICHLVRQGPETRSFASERRRVFFLRKGRDPRCDESYVSPRKRVLIDDFFRRKIDENRDMRQDIRSTTSRCFSIYWETARSPKIK